MGSDVSVVKVSADPALCKVTLSRSQLSNFNSRALDALFFENLRGTGSRNRRFRRQGGLTVANNRA
jgi:hypothetical protein